MPEDFPAPGDHLARPVQPEVFPAAVMANMLMNQVDTIVDTSGAIVAPGTYGIKPRSENEVASVVLETSLETIRSDGTVEAHPVIIVKRSTSEGDRFELVGMHFDERSRKRPVASVPISPGERVVLGRAAQLPGGQYEGKPEELVSAAMLFGEGMEYSRNTSRQQVAFAEQAGKLRMTINAANEMPVTARYDSANPLYPSPMPPDKAKATVAAIPPAQVQEDSPTVEDVGSVTSIADVFREDPGALDQEVAKQWTHEPAFVPAPSVSAESPGGLPEHVSLERDKGLGEGPRDGHVEIPLEHGTDVEHDLSADSTESPVPTDYLVIRGLAADAEDAKRIIAARAASRGNSGNVGTFEQQEAVEAKPATQDETMQALHEQWGLPEGVAVPEAMAGLDRALAVVRSLRGLLGEDSARSLTDLMQRFWNTDRDQVVSFNMHHIEQAGNYLRSLAATMQHIGEDNGILLPKAARGQLSDIVVLSHAVQQIEGAMSQYRPGMPDLDAMNNSRRILNVTIAHGAVRVGYIDDMFKTNFDLERQIEEKRAALVGYAAASAGENQAEVEKFADDRIAELAIGLRKEGVSDDEVQRAVVAMERYLNDAIDTSGLPFPRRVLDNDMHTREGGAKEGQRARSRIVTAEMAVDMLRGKFDVVRANSHQVTVDRNGLPTLGQHRAGAFMTLYGKDWIKKAEAAGHKIITT